MVLIQWYKKLGGGYIFCRSFSMLMILLLVSCVGTPPAEISEKAIAKVNIELPSINNIPLKFLPIDYLTVNARPWWKDFSDPELEKLVKVTLANATDIKQSMARLEEAIANAGGSHASRLPSINLDVQNGVNSADLEDGGLVSNPNRTNTASASFVLDWQADLFGELRNASKADKVLVEGQALRVRDAQRLVVAQTVQNYYQLVSIRARIKLTHRSVIRRSENVQRIDELLEQGYATMLDKTRTDSQLYEARALLAQLELDEVSLLNQLSLFAGIYPGEMRALVKGASQLAVTPDDVPLPSISVLIEHRPDLRAVERDLVAAAYQVNAAKAALYPSLGFRLNVGKSTGQVGVNSGSYPALNAISGGILSNIAMPILGRGRLISAIDANSARLQQAHHTFESTMLQAITDLDTSVVAISKNRQIYQQRQLASSSAKAAAELSKELFQAGELDYTSVIVAEQTRVSAENSEINAKLASLIAYSSFLSSVAPAW